MPVTEAPEIGGGESRSKVAVPAVAAVGIITAIVGASLLANVSQSPAPEAANPTATSPNVASPTVTTPSVTPPSAIEAAPTPGGPAPPVSGPPQPQFNQPGSPAAGQASMEIVVKFKDDARVKEIIDAFWRDQGSARTRFDAWKSSRPEFAGLKLDRVTYSNELVLVHDGSVPAAQRLPAMRAIAAKLGAAADISYAEPNMTAHPGGR